MSGIAKCALGRGSPELKQGSAGHQQRERAATEASPVGFYVSKKFQGYGANAWRGRVVEKKDSSLSLSGSSVSSKSVKKFVVAWYDDKGYKMSDRTSMTLAEILRCKVEHNNNDNNNNSNNKNPKPSQNQNPNHADTSGRRRGSASARKPPVEVESGAIKARSRSLSPKKASRASKGKGRGKGKAASSALYDLECRKCTLINRWNAVKCSACGTKLLLMSSSKRRKREEAGSSSIDVTMVDGFSDDGEDDYDQEEVHLTCESDRFERPSSFSKSNCTISESNYSPPASTGVSRSVSRASSYSPSLSTVSTASSSSSSSSSRARPSRATAERRTAKACSLAGDIAAYKPTSHSKKDSEGEEEEEEEEEEDEEEEEEEEKEERKEGQKAEEGPGLERDGPVRGRLGRIVGPALVHEEEGEEKDRRRSPRRDQTSGEGAPPRIQPVEKVSRGRARVRVQDG